MTHEEALKTISAEVVERTWQRMAMGGVAEGQRLVTQMSKKQPFVQAYLLGVGERDFNPDEAQLLHYLGMVVWQIFAHNGRHLAMVTGDALDRAEEVNMKMLEHLEAEPESDFRKTVERLRDDCSQVAVLKYVVDAMMEEPEEGCDIREEKLGLMFIHLMTVIDCLDQGR